MDGTMPTTWTEVQIDNDSISLSLITEGDDGARVEDTARFTFEELKEKTGHIESLRPSRERQSRLEELKENVGRQKESPPPWVSKINEGDPMVDVNPPEWSDDARVYVTEVTDMRADNCYINDYTSVTVADKNPSFDRDDTVVKAEYVNGNGKEYAFPSRRLRKPFDEDFPFPQRTGYYG